MGRERSARRVVAFAAILGLAACSGNPPVPASSRPSAAVSATLAPPPGLTNVTVEPDKASEILIPRSGGSVSATASNGATYTLDIPPGALDADTAVAMYPVTAVAGLTSGAPVVGVHFLPEGLRLAFPATLTIRLPAGADAQHLIGFRYTGNAENLAPRPIAIDGNTVTMRVSHFSGWGAVPYDVRFGSSGSEEHWPQTLLDVESDPAHSVAAVDQVLKDWYHAIVEPSLRACSASGTAFVVDPCDLDSDGPLNAEIAYDDWLFAVRWAKALDPVTVSPELSQAKSLAIAHLRDYYVALNDRCSDRAGGPVDGNGPSSALYWAGLALGRVGDWAALWGIATAASNLDADSLLAGLCVQILIDPSRDYAASGPGQTGALRIPMYVTIRPLGGNGGPTRTDIPIVVTLGYDGTSLQGNPGPDGVYHESIRWPDGLDPIVFGIDAHLASDNPNVERVHVFEQLVKHAGKPPAIASPQPIGAAIKVGTPGSVPIVGVCQQVRLEFGVGHNGANGWQFSLVTAATAFDASGGGTLETSDPSSPTRLFNAGGAVGTSTIDATGYVIDPKATVSAHTVITIDFLVGIYRDATTNTSVAVIPGLAFGGALPPGTYALALPGGTFDYLVPNGFTFTDSGSGRDLVLTIDDAGMSGTLNGQSVTLPRTCA
jgi:hypothetical protein